MVIPGSMPFFGKCRLTINATQEIQIFVLIITIRNAYSTGKNSVSGSFHFGVGPASPSTQRQRESGCGRNDIILRRKGGGTLH